MSSLIVCLPIEVISEILGHIKQPDHLNNASKVCKIFHDLVVPRLYRHLIVDGFDQEDSLQCLLRSEQLKHVRIMTVVGKFNAENEGRVLQLLEQLQPDTLEAFDWELALHSRTRGLLGHFQRHQMRLQKLGGQVRDEKQNSQPSIAHRLPATLPRLQNYRCFVELHEKKWPIISRLCQYENLQQLSLEGACVVDSNMLEMLTGLFDLNSLRNLNLLPLFPGLTSLTLKYSDLGSAGEEWLEAIDISRLKVIRLLNGRRYSSVMEHMIEIMEASRPQSWETFEFRHLQTEETIECMLEDLLRFNLELRHISICIMGPDQFLELGGITWNASSLESLTLDHIDFMYPNDEYCRSQPKFWRLDNFNSFCFYAESLKHLSCTIPDHHIGEDPTKDWCEWINCIGQLSELVTLRISNWPQVSDTLSISDRAYYQGVREYAERIFQATFDWTEFNESSGDEDDLPPQTAPDSGSTDRTQTSAKDNEDPSRPDIGVTDMAAIDAECVESSCAATTAGYTGARKLRYIGFGSGALYATHGHEDQAVYERIWIDGESGRIAKAVPVSKGFRVWEGGNDLEGMNQTLRFKPLNRPEAVRQAREEEGEERFEEYLRLNERDGGIDPADLAM